SAIGERGKALARRICPWRSLGKEPDRWDALMRRLAVSVEGSTEREFVKQVLQPHLWNLQIDIRPVVVTTKRLVSGPNHKGGSVSVDRAVSEVRRLLPNFDAVTTFYDFYGFVGKEPGDTTDDIEQRISGRLGNPDSF